MSVFDNCYVFTPVYSSAREYLLSIGGDTKTIGNLYSLGFKEPGFVSLSQPSYSSSSVYSIREFYPTMYIDSGNHWYSVRAHGDYFISDVDYYFFPNNPWIHVTQTMSSSYFLGSGYAFIGSSYVRVFYTKQDYLNWYNKGKSGFYASTNFYNYSPTDITINSSSVKNYTENNTTNKIYNETVNNITNQGGEPSLTQDDVQKIVDDAVQKILDSMPTPTPEPTDIPTPTPGGGGSGGDSGGDSGDSSDSSTKEFFQKICDYFEENNKKLEDIVNLLDTAGKSDCNYDYSQISEFLTTLWNESDKKFDTMINLLEKNNEYQEKMLDSLNQIKALLVVDTVLDVFKDRSSETANKAKEKFPTSVPWDVAMIVNAMSAEPQAPVMKLPLVLEQFGISEEITIDLSTDEWEKLAKLCRYMLSLLFLLFMVHLTRKLFYKDGDN